MSLDPNYATTPKIGQATVSAANANRDGTGTIATIFTAGASGSEAFWIRVKALAATTAGMIRIFLHDGTAYRGLLLEIPVAAITPSASVAAFEALIPLTLPGGNMAPFLPLSLPTSWSIRASTHNAESFSVTIGGGDF